MAVGASSNADRDGAVNMTSESMLHWQMFRAGQHMVPQPENLAPAKRSKSWTERTREKLLSRDGMDCFFCGKTMELDHEGRPTETGKPDITGRLSLLGTVLCQCV